MIENHIFIRGNFCNLFVLSAEFATKSDWFSLLNNAELTTDMDKHIWPNTRAMQLEFVETIPETDLVLGVSDKQNRFCGIVSLNDISFIHGRANHSQMMDTSQKINPKITVEANHLLFRHAFDNLRLTTIYGGSVNKEKTDLMVRFYRFELDGVRPNYLYKGGIYRDLYLISLRKENYEYGQ